MLQKLGKSDQTRDEVFEEFVANFNKQHVSYIITENQLSNSLNIIYMYSICMYLTHLLIIYNSHYHTHWPTHSLTRLFTHLLFPPSLHLSFLSLLFVPPSLTASLHLSLIHSFTLSCYFSSRHVQWNYRKKWLNTWTILEVCWQLNSNI